MDKNKSITCNNNKCVLHTKCSTYVTVNQKNTISVKPLLRAGALFKNYYCMFFKPKHLKNINGQGKI